MNNEDTSSAAFIQLSLTNGDVLETQYPREELDAAFESICEKVQAKPGPNWIAMGGSLIKTREIIAVSRVFSR